MGKRSTVASDQCRTGRRKSVFIGRPEGAIGIHVLIYTQNCRQSVPTTPFMTIPVIFRGLALPATLTILLLPVLTSTALLQTGAGAVGEAVAASYLGLLARIKSVIIGSVGTVVMVMAASSCILGLGESPSHS